MAMPEIDKDIDALRAMQRARWDFVEKICMESATQDREIINILRFDTTFELAEFYYMLEAMNLKDPGDFANIADLHNAHIVNLSKDKAAQRRRNLTPERLIKAMFTIDTWDKAKEIWDQQPGALDQSTLARLLFSQMSPEKVRKLVLAATEAGFMTRTQIPFGSVVVVSTGVMERIFGECIREMRLTIARL